MIRLQEIQSEKQKLNSRMQELQQLQSEKYQEYERFLSLEYTTKLYKILTEMNFEATNYSDEDLEVLLSIIDEYVHYKRIDKFILKEDYEMTCESYLKFLGNYGLLTEEYLYTDKDKKYKPYIKCKLEKAIGPRNSLLGIIDMDKLIQYVMERLSQHKEEEKINFDNLDMIISEMQNNGISNREIMDILRIKYITLANQEIRRKAK